MAVTPIMVFMIFGVFFMAWFIVKFAIGFLWSLIMIFDSSNSPDDGDFVQAGWMGLAHSGIALAILGSLEWIVASELIKLIKLG